MELKQFVSVLWKWAWLIVLAALVAAAAGYWVDSRTPRVYRSSTTLMVGQFIQSPDPQLGDFTAAQQLAQNYAILARQPPVLKPASDSLSSVDPTINPGSLAGQVNATVIPNTQMLQVSVVDTDPRRAAILADEVARQLIRQSPTPSADEQEAQRQFVNQQLGAMQTRIEAASNDLDELDRRLEAETSARALRDLTSQRTSLQEKMTAWQNTYGQLLQFLQGSRINHLTVVEPAAVPSVAVSPASTQNILLAVAIGAVLALGAAFLLEYLDDTIKTVDVVERLLALPTLGTISSIPKARDPSGQLVVMQDPLSSASEAYRVLRTNIQFSSLGSPASRLLIASAVSGEGTTTTASNLAITMAQAGKRVVLVDADLRRPSVHRLFSLPNRVGLTSLLLDESLAPDAALMPTPIVGLMVLPCGPLPPNPAELLGSDRMQQRVNQLQALADIIIFDSPAVLAVADASILGALCNGAILVVDGRRTRSQSAMRAKARLEQVGVKIFGVVLNNVQPGHTYYPHSARSGVAGWLRAGATAGSRASGQSTAGGRAQ
jgi:capsular exopolysaccharide synthesis family protein